MLFFSRRYSSACKLEPERGAVSLGLFAGRAADSWLDQQPGFQDFYAELPAPRAATRRDWRPYRSPSGVTCLVVGWIDNCAELAGQLGCPQSDAAVYAAAVERWGDGADSRIIGEYAALCALPDGSVRLARSPWSSFPLFYYRLGPDLAVSSIPRPLFASGAPRKLHPGAIDLLLSFELPDPTTSQFEGIEVVPGGTIVHLKDVSERRFGWYDPVAISQVRFAHDDDYVEAAADKLAEATRHALARSTRPAISLSGGLDSATVCDEAWRQTGTAKPLFACTFVPVKGWHGKAIPPMFADDRDHVEAFLQMHPGLDHRFVDNCNSAYDTWLDQLLLAGDAAYPAAALGFVHFGVYAAARDRGCDWLLGAGMGNLAFSSEAPWAAAEFFRTGKWGRLIDLARGNLDDPRPLWRRFIAMGLMPNLPASIRTALRSIVHRGRDTTFVTNPYLSPYGRLAAQRSHANARRNISDLDFFGPRERMIRNAYDMSWQGGEAGHAVEQVFGIRHRDVMAYRPLLELVLGMPTEQFVQGSTRRHLARRVAKGRLPERQRLEPRHGDHLPDWQARMAPGLDRLREEGRLIAGHPELSGLLDSTAMLADLENWPSAPVTDLRTATRLRFALPAMAMIRRFVDFETGRNPE